MRGRSTFDMMAAAPLGGAPAGALAMLVAALLAALLLLAPAPALSADELTVSVTDVDLSTFPEAEAVVQIGGEAAMRGEFDPEGLELIVDGEPISDVTIEATDSEPVPSVTVLLVDESGSMKGAPMDAAADAALRFVAAMRAQDRVGVYAFDEEFRTLQEPTGDPEALNSAIERLTPRRETALYDAVIRSLQSLEAVDGAGAAYLVVLSDGGDTASAAPLAEVLAQARATDAQIYTVGLLGNEFDAEPLRQMAEATGGRYLEAPDPGDLGDLYSSLAQEIQNQFRITLTLDAQATGSGTLLVRTEAGDTVAEAERGFFYPQSTTAETPTTEAPAGDTEGAATEGAATEASAPANPQQTGTWAAAFVHWGGSDYVVIALLFLILLVAGYLLIGILAPRRDVLEEYSDILENRRNLGPRSTGGTGSNGEETGRRPGEVFVQKLAGLRGYEGPLQQRIEAAGWQVRSSEFILFHLAGMLLLIVLVITVRVPFFAAVLLVVAGGLAPLLYLDYRARKRREAFEDQIPDTLLMMAGSFRAGQSFEQAMQVVASEGPKPMATEFSRVLAQQRLGIAPEAALRTLADRMESEAFDWVVMATLIQRQVGGNLAEVYEKIAHTLRERVKLAQMVKTLTAEGRLSAIILIALPFFVAAGILVLNPGYLEPLYTTTMGYVLIGIALAGMAFGVLWIRKIIRIEA